jgi:methionyl-tRNA synthetase
MVKPWEIAKRREKDPEAEAHLGDVLAQAVGSLMQIASQLAPFLPETSDMITHTFETGVVIPIDRPGGLFPKRYLHTEDPHAKKTPKTA